MRPGLLMARRAPCSLTRTISSSESASRISVFFEHDEKRFFIYAINGAWEAVPSGVD